MFHTHRKALGAGFATALVLGAIAAPGALAEPTDLRTPDARDAAAAAPRGDDMRSPDTRDFAEGRQIVASTPIKITEVQTAAGFDWSDAAIGAGGALAILLVGFGGTSVVLRRRRHVVATSEPAGLVG